MLRRHLEIEWPHQPLEIEEAINNVLIVRDPLVAVSKIFVYAPLSDEARKWYSTRNVKDFWKFV